MRYFLFYESTTNHLSVWKNIKEPQVLGSFFPPKNYHSFKHNRGNVCMPGRVAEIRLAKLLLTKAQNFQVFWNINFLENKQYFFVTCKHLKILPHLYIKFQLLQITNSQLGAVLPSKRHFKISGFCFSVHTLGRVKRKSKQDNFTDLSSSISQL